MINKDLFLKMKYDYKNISNINDILKNNDIKVNNSWLINNIYNRLKGVKLHSMRKIVNNLKNEYRNIYDSVSRIDYDFLNNKVIENKLKIYNYLLKINKKFKNMIIGNNAEEKLINLLLSFKKAKKGKGRPDMPSPIDYDDKDETDDEEYDDDEAEKDDMRDKHDEDEEEILKLDYNNDLKDMLFERKKDLINANYDLSKIAEIANLLSGFSKFKTEDIKSKKIESIEGKTTLHRRMRDISEIEFVPSEILMESNLLDKRLLALDIIENKLMVEKNATREFSKQLIFILLDVSGSMDTINTKSIAISILLNRLNCVLNEGCKMFLAPFDYQIKGIKLIENKIDAEKLLDDLTGRYFAGYSTRIAQCMKSACHFINNMQGYKPELILVTDGADEVDYYKLAPLIVGIKFHCILISDTINNALKSLAENNKGLFLHFNWKTGKLI